MSVPQAIVLGSSPTALYAVRELAFQGVTVTLLDGERQSASFSRYVSGFLRYTPGDALAESMISPQHEALHGAVLLPTSDSWIEWLCRYAERLSLAYRFSDGYADGTALALMDKAQFAGLCREHGIAAPGCWVGPPADLRAHAGHAQYPCLIKPAMIHRVREQLRGGKLFVAHSAGELLRRLDSLPASDCDWVLQELIPGPESNITLYGGYFDADSTPHQSFSCRKLRQFPPGFGSASLVVSETLAETRRISESFLGAVAYSGIAGAEFKFDPRDGLTKIIEINPRPTLWFGLSQHCGKRIALASQADLCGDPPPDDLPQRDDVVWRYLLKDIWSAGYYRLRRGVAGLPPPDIQASRHKQRVGPLLQRGDPWPVWGEARNYMLTAVRRLVG